MAGLISPSPVSFLQSGGVGGSGGGTAQQQQQQQYNLNVGVLPQAYQQHQQRAGTIGLGGGLGGGIGGGGGGVNVNLSYSDSPSLPAHLSHQQANQYMNAFQGGGLGLPVGVGGLGGVGLNSGSVGGITGVGPGHEEGKLFSLVIDLMDPNTRETALLELSKKREQWDDLAMVLWHSFGAYFVCILRPERFNRGSRTGIMPALLQEIVSVYPLLSPPNLTAHVSNRVCNALALLQCVASHSETRQLFLNGAFSPGTANPAKHLCARHVTWPYSSHPAVPVPVPQHNI